jgi:hypothetical protein
MHDGRIAFVFRTFDFLDIEGIPSWLREAASGEIHVFEDEDIFEEPVIYRF